MPPLMLLVIVGCAINAIKGVNKKVICNFIQIYNESTTVLTYLQIFQYKIQIYRLPKLTYSDKNKL